MNGSDFLLIYSILLGCRVGFHSQTFVPLNHSPLYTATNVLQNHGIEDFQLGSQVRRVQEVSRRIQDFWGQISDRIQDYHWFNSYSIEVARGLHRRISRSSNLHLLSLSRERNRIKLFSSFNPSTWKRFEPERKWMNSCLSTIQNTSPKVILVFVQH